MYVRTSNDLGAIVRDRRRAAGLTQADLADTLGVTRRSVINLEKGIGAVRSDTVLAALSALNIRLWADIGDGAPLPGAAPADPDAVDTAALIDDLLDEL